MTSDNGIKLETCIQVVDRLSLRAANLECSDSANSIIPAHSST